MAGTGAVRGGDTVFQTGWQVGCVCDVWKGVWACVGVCGIVSEKGWILESSSGSGTLRRLPGGMGGVVVEYLSQRRTIYMHTLPGRRR